MRIRCRDENMILAYIDLRPSLFVIGFPVVISLALLGCWIAKARIVKWKAVLFSTATSAALFGFFLYGPFIDEIETREHIMTWEI